jgi:rSAM/selenodomain-associated transferase 1
MKTLEALVVMLKAPEAGKVKTRLVPPLSGVEAGELYTCFIRDTFNTVAALKDVDVFAAYTPPGSREHVQSILPDGVSLTAQKGAGLGERLGDVFTRLLKLGYRRVAVMGSDSPDLPIVYIKEAYRELEEMASGGAVLGPTRDGGYYLVAMDRQLNALFEGVPWSSPSTLEATLANARAAGIPVRLLRPWYDVDRFEDLALVIDAEAAPETFGYIRSKGLLQRQHCS